MRKIILIAYLDYNKKNNYYYENIYFKKPTTRHTNPDVVAKKVKIICEVKK